MNYVLITPVKNEAKFLPILANCIINQTVLPRLWVIVDGNSSDNSVEIIQKLCRDYDWIYLHKQETITKQKNHLNFSYGVYEGYEYIKQICTNKEIEFDYIGKLDADIIISNNFFEKLIIGFEINSKLCVASGASYGLKDETIDPEYIDFSNYTRNNYLPQELPDKRLYRKECLDEVGGFPLSKYSPDTILLAKIRIRGWEIKTFDDVKIYNLRKDTGTERNLWKSSKSYGHNRYYLNYHPFLVFMNATVLFLKKPHYTAFSYIMGYLSSVIRRDPKIDDSEIKNYFYFVRPKEIINNILKNYKL